MRVIKNIGKGVIAACGVYLIAAGAIILWTGCAGCAADPQALQNTIALLNIYLGGMSFAALWLIHKLA